MSEGAKPRRRSFADALFVPCATLCLFVYFAATSEYFLEGLNITNIFLQGSILAIVSFGVTFVILSGDLDLSVGSGVALVSVVAAIAMRDTGSILLGLGVAITIGLVIGVVNGLLVTRLRIPSFIATFGTLVVAHGIALAITNGGVVSGLPMGLVILASEGILGVPWLIWITGAVFAVLYFVQTQTAFGVRVVAIGGNPDGARLAGINVTWIRTLVFLLCGLTVGIAGMALTARLQSGQPNAGTLLALDAITAVVIGGTSLTGGRGSLIRTLWGVLLIAVLRNGMDLEGIDDSLKQVIVGFVLILAASADFVRRRISNLRSKENLIDLT